MPIWAPPCQSLRIVLSVAFERVPADVDVTGGGCGFGDQRQIHGFSSDPFKHGSVPFRNVPSLSMKTE